MSNPNKKYYWLKLKDDFFRQKEIKKLRKIAGGDTYTIIYLKMLLLAIKNDNKLYFDGVEEDFASELALDLDEEEDNVKITLSFLLRQGMVEMINEEEFLMTRCEDMIGAESSSASRVRKFREKKKLQENDGKMLQCNADVTESNKNVTTETDTEKEIEQETELDIETEKETKLEQQQYIERKDAVDLVRIYFHYLNDKDVNSIVDEFLKTGKNLYYLSEKLILLSDTGKVENKVGYLLSAIKEDYQLRNVTSFENLLMVWEHELSLKPKNPIIADRVKYYRYMRDMQN